MVSQNSNPPYSSHPNNSVISNECILCGHNEWENHIKLNEFTILKCKNCTLGQTYPLPNQAEIIETNKTVYSINQRISTYQVRQKELSQRYNRFINQIIDLHPGTRMKILDIGCSLGFFLLEAQKRGLETYGVEISELSAEYAQKQFGLNVFTGTLEAAHFLDKSFDIITLWDVIEHIPEPICLLTEVKRVLKDDGVLALQSPNMDSMMASLTKEQWNWWTVPDHLFHFTPLSMSRLIESNGFDILKSYTWEPPNDLVLNLLIAGLCLRFPSNNIIIRIIGKVITVFSNWVGPVITPIQKINWRRQKGGLIVVYAQKNKCEPR